MYEHQAVFHLSVSLPTFHHTTSPGSPGENSTTRYEAPHLVYSRFLGQTLNHVFVFADNVMENQPRRITALAMPASCAPACQAVFDYGIFVRKEENHILQCHTLTHTHHIRIQRKHARFPPFMTKLPF